MKLFEYSIRTGSTTCWHFGKPSSSYSCNAYRRPYLLVLVRGTPQSMHESTGKSESTEFSQQYVYESGISLISDLCPNLPVNTCVASVRQYHAWFSRSSFSKKCIKSFSSETCQAIQF